jgi:hypothetical protein
LQDKRFLFFDVDIFIGRTGKGGHDLGIIIGTYSSVFIASPIIYVSPERKKVCTKVGLVTCQA